MAETTPSPGDGASRGGRRRPGSGGQRNGWPTRVRSPGRDRGCPGRRTGRPRRLTAGLARTDLDCCWQAGASVWARL